MAEARAEPADEAAASGGGRADETPREALERMPLSTRVYRFGSATLEVYCVAYVEDTRKVSIAMQNSAQEIWDSFWDFGDGEAQGGAPGAGSGDSPRAPSPPRSSAGLGSPPPSVDPLGLDVWPGALALCAYLSAPGAPRLDGVEAIELGAGVGLPSLLSGTLGALRVVTTDYEPVACELASWNARRNGLERIVEPRCLDWSEALRRRPAGGGLLGEGLLGIDDDRATRLEGRGNGRWDAPGTVGECCPGDAGRISPAERYASPASRAPSSARSVSGGRVAYPSAPVISNPLASHAALTGVPSREAAARAGASAGGVNPLGEAAHLHHHHHHHHHRYHCEGVEGDQAPYASQTPGEGSGIGGGGAQGGGGAPGGGGIHGGGGALGGDGALGGVFAPRSARADGGLGSRTGSELSGPPPLSSAGSGFGKQPCAGGFGPAVSGPLPSLSPSSSGALSCLVPASTPSRSGASLDLWTCRHRFRLVLAADVLYELALVPSLVASLASALHPEGLALVAHQTRRALRVKSGCVVLERDDSPLALFRERVLAAGLRLKVLGALDAGGSAGPLFLFAAAWDDAYLDGLPPMLSNGQDALVGGLGAGGEALDDTKARGASRGRRGGGDGSSRPSSLSRSQSKSQASHPDPAHPVSIGAPAATLPSAAPIGAPASTLPFAALAGAPAASVSPVSAVSVEVSDPEAPRSPTPLHPPHHHHHAHHHDGLAVHSAPPSISGGSPLQPVAAPPAASQRPDLSTRSEMPGRRGEARRGAREGLLSREVGPRRTAPAALPSTALLPPSRVAELLPPSAALPLISDGVQTQGISASTVSKPVHTSPPSANSILDQAVSGLSALRVGDEPRVAGRERDDPDFFSATSGGTVNDNTWGDERA